MKQDYYNFEVNYLNGKTQKFRKPNINIVICEAIIFASNNAYEPDIAYIFNSDTNETFFDISVKMTKMSHSQQSEDMMEMLDKRIVNGINNNKIFNN